MSADNSYFVIRRGNEWRVVMGFYSDWMSDDGGEYVRGLFDRAVTAFHDRSAALVAAHDMVDNTSVVEYGVTEVDYPEVAA